LLAFVIFSNDDERTRRTIVNLAFGDCERDPRPGIQYAGSVMDFAVHLVDTLLKHGCAGRGRHSLSLLIETLARARGRRTDPDFAELPHLLDRDCALPTREEELGYLRDLVAREEAMARLYSPLRGLAEAQPEDPLAASLAPWQDHKDIALLLHRPRPRDAGRDAAPRSPPRPYDDILVAFAEVRQAALLGAPGAGKSTTLRQLAVDRARAALGSPQAPVPLLASLGYWRADEDLGSFLAGREPQIGWAAAALARQGRLVLLLDGLNEVPSAQRRAKTDRIRAFRARLPEDTPFIVSCRRDDYVGDLRLDLDSLGLEPLSPRRVRAVLQRWLAHDPAGAERLFWQLAGDERLAGVLQTWRATGADEEAFWSVSDPQAQQQAYAGTSVEEDAIWRRHVPDPRSLLRLAANPFMLTMLYVTWIRHRGALPRNRGDLFGGFVESLLSREGLIQWDGDGAPPRRDARAERLLDGLAGVAMAMQNARRTRGAAPQEEAAQDAGVLTVLPRPAVVRLLGEPALLKIAEDATLLEGHDEVRFRHQLLQEYFTAVALRGQLASGGLGADRLWPRARWWARSGWEEAAVLLAGLHSDDCTPVIRWLRDAQPEVAAQCLLDSGGALADREGLLRELHDTWLARLTDTGREPDPEARAAIGRALGRLGLDDRQGVGLTGEGLPDIDWVAVPGGEFPYQEGERRRLEAFRIGRYPVTHGQLQAFLEAPDGYADDRWWAGFEDPSREPRPARWPIANHPRETVSWFEALAFCGWLGHRLGVERQGLEIRLPTEWEWERAARGSGGRLYPWGDQYRAGHANIDETLLSVGPNYLAQTSAVGLYPQGASPEGGLDLAGNVWEWCLTEYAEPERTGRADSESRVLRGGSWDGDQDGARADYRLDDHPGNRFESLGFRVLCGSPIR
jgi:formylglycine-generating enzyme required for sulfatase activity